MDLSVLDGAYPSLVEYVSPNAVQEVQEQEEQKNDAQIKSGFQLMAPFDPFADAEQAEDEQSDDSQAFTGDNEVSILTFNILADAYVPRRDRKEWTEERKDLVFNWNMRLPRVLKVLTRYPYDIICLQEVDKYEALYKVLKPLKYTGVFVQRNSKLDGCAVFFRCKKFKMVRKYPVHLDHCRKYIGLTYPRRASSRNVGSIVVLVPLDWKVKKGRVVSMGSDPNATGVIVVACHLQWRPTNVDIKLLQTHMLLEEAEVVRQRFGKFASNLGILFCGDFNSQPDSMAYEYVRSGKVDLEKWKSLQTHIEGFKRKNKYYHKKERESEKVLELNFGHSFKFHSTYEDYRECKEEPLVTNWTENFKGCLDYIFYTPQFTLSKRLALFSEQELNERGITSLPNEHFPSDHLPLGAVFRMAPYIRPEKEEEEEQEEQEQDKQDKQDKKEGQKGEPKEQADKKEGNQEETQANGDEETAEGGD